METLATTVLLLQSLPSCSPWQSPAVLGLQLDLLLPAPQSTAGGHSTSCALSLSRQDPCWAWGHKPCTACPPEPSPVCTRGIWETLSPGPVSDVDDQLVLCRRES